MSTNLRPSLRFYLPFAWGAAGLALLGACAADRAMQVPPGQPAVVSSAPADTTNRAPKATKAATSGLRADGAACFMGSQCLSTSCEGASCDGSSPGSCVPEDRTCAADLVDYCGCDGNTFAASSSCPGEAFAKQGRCDEAPAPDER